MQSFAFWYEKSNINDEKKLTAKLNFNLWTECGWKKDKTFLDIGFMVHNISLADRLCFFVPIKMDINNIKDLGFTLKESTLASAIFNENLAVTNSNKNDKIINIKNNETNDSFNVYILDTKNATTKARDIQIDGFDDGTILYLDVKNKTCFGNEPVYFRFRIQDADFSKVIHKYSSGKKGLQSVFNKIYTIDFRYMNKRSLSESLLEKINEEKSAKVKIESVHFLLLTKTYVDLKTDCSSVRKLEEKVWDDYVNLDKDSKIKNFTNDLIAYHYKKNFDKGDNAKKEDSATEFFVKYNIEKSVVWLYLLVTVFIGALSSIIASCIIDYMMK